MAALSGGRFVNARTGAGLRGVTPSLLSTGPMTVARREGIVQGTAYDREISNHINSGTPVRSKRGIETLAVLPTLVHPRRVTLLESQVPVCNLTNGVGTFADVIVHGGARHCVVVELKYCSWSDTEYAHPPDATRPTYRIPSHPVIHARYMAQLSKTMLLHARTHRRRSGAVLYGALIVATSTKPLVFRRQIVYMPNTGINYNRRARNARP